MFWESLTHTVYEFKTNDWYWNGITQLMFLYCRKYNSKFGNWGYDTFPNKALEIWRISWFLVNKSKRYDWKSVILIWDFWVMPEPTLLLTRFLIPQPSPSHKQYVYTTRNDRYSSILYVHPSLSKQNHEWGAKSLSLLTRPQSTFRFPWRAWQGGTRCHWKEERGYPSGRRVFQIAEGAMAALRGIKTKQAKFGLATIKSHLNE